MRARRLAIQRVGCDRLAVLHRLARELGIDLSREIDDGQWQIPFTYRHLAVLTLHALEFEFTPDVPAPVRYVGPLLLEARGGTEDAGTSAALGILFERRRSGDVRRLVFVGFGSFFSTDTSLVRRVAQAAALRPEWAFVVSLGSQHDPSSLGRLPENVHAFRWVPQLDVLRHADASLNHGGINTIDECVHRGVPSLMYCGGATDMAGTVARARFHGVGIAGDRRTDTPGDIVAALERLFEDDEIGGAVERLRRAYLAYETERVAEGVVTSLLETPPPRLGSIP